MPFGRIKEVEQGSSSQVISRLMAGFEAHGCEVKRLGGERLEVLVPGWDAQVFPFESILPLQQWFWDRMVVTVAPDGTARYRMVYWSGAQPLLHLLIATVFAWEAWFGPSVARSPSWFLTGFVLAHLVPVLITVTGFRFSSRAAFRSIG